MGVGGGAQAGMCNDRECRARVCVRVCARVRLHRAPSHTTPRHNRHRTLAVHCCTWHTWHTTPRRHATVPRHQCEPTPRYTTTLPLTPCPPWPCLLSWSPICSAWSWPSPRYAPAVGGGWHGGRVGAGWVAGWVAGWQGEGRWEEAGAAAGSSRQAAAATATAAGFKSATAHARNTRRARRCAVQRSVASAYVVVWCHARGDDTVRDTTHMSVCGAMVARVCAQA